jgi:hypothetical protein
MIMTENEKEVSVAIEHLKARNMSAKHIDIAIQALAEIQEYRAIGTVKEIKIKQAEFAVLSKRYLADLRELMEYQKIGTIEEFKALKEKNEPKKAIGKRKYDEAYCPACNEVISDGEFWALDEYVHHCNYCGQAVKGVDWQ